MELQLTNIVTISVSAAQAGIGNFNTSNLAVFTRETPADSFGTLGYKIYLEPSEVGLDFGTDSETYAMANKIFAQKPNILAGNGYLVVIPFVDGTDAQQTIAFSGVAASGSFKLNYEGTVTSALDWDATAGEIQTELRLLQGLGAVTVSGSIASQSLVVTFAGVGGVPPLLTVSDENLQTSAPAGITVTVSATVVGTNETMDAAIARTKDLVQYFGVLAAEITPADEIMDAADVIQTLNKIAFWPRRDEAAVASSGVLDDLRTGSLQQNRGLFYEGDGVDADTLEFSAAYAGRALSTNFTGSNTTQTMHLKDLIGVQPDSAMTQTLLNLCLAAGADVYASFQGVPKTFTSGANAFFDQIYNQQWIVGALQVAGFNALAQSSTKLPQTEEGVGILKGAYRTVCEQGVSNQYLAPGTWNSSTTFGVQSDFFRNISERGYYIYSSPVATQSSADREDRKAPLIQIALKEAGAIHSTSVIININA